ncbi:MAG: hypothetical protein WDZ91_04455 [Paenibacillaceae bacterium]
MRTLSSVFLLVMVITLAACGGANSDNENAVTGNENVISDHKDAVTLEPGNAVDEPLVNEPVKPDANGKLAATMKFEITVNGNVETQTGTLAVSDNGYHLYILPQFKFTPEEPNADQVYMDKLEDSYMRILTLGAEPDLTDIRANAEEELAMIGDVVELTGDQIAEPALRDSTFYLHSSDSTLSKDIILREINGEYFKIIVNMPTGEALESVAPSFLAMIKSIEPTRP